MRFIKSNTSYILIVFLLVCCGSNTDTPPEAIVASVGSTNITAIEFENSYLAGSQRLKGQDSPKRTFLQAMIKEELLAALLKEDSSYTERVRIVKALQLLEQELLVEQMFNTEVHDKVTVSDEEIRQEVLNSPISVKSRYIACKDPTLAAKLLALLDAGNAFETLLDELPSQLRSQVILDSTDYLSPSEIQAPINDVLANLKPGEISEVIPLENVFVILKCDDRIQEIVDEKDFVKYADRFTKVITYKKRLAQSRTFIKSFMDPLQVEVDGKAFAFLVNTLYELYVNIPYEAQNLPEIQGDGREVPGQDIMDQIQGVAHEPAVRFQGGVLNIQTLLDLLLLKPFHIESSTKQDFGQELNAEIAIALRDYFLAQEATRRGYHELAAIGEELDAWQEKLLVQDYIQDLRQKQMARDSEIESYFTKQGLPIEKGEARWKQRQQQLTSEKCVRILENLVDSLQAITPITIYEDELHKIDVGTQGVVQGSDVHFFKLGLPYLRSAFPVPDPIWANH